MKKKYYLVLAYGEKIYLTQDERDAVFSAWNSKGDQKIEIGRNAISTRQIKGIFPIENKDIEQKNQQVSKHIAEIKEDFNRDCLLWSKKTPEEKAKREMQVRIVPGWKLEGGKREDREMMVCYQTVLAFFRENPKYPRCPARVWWSILEARLKDKNVSRFWEYVARNDFVIKQWVKKQ